MRLIGAAIAAWLALVSGAVACQPIFGESAVECEGVVLREGASASDVATSCPTMVELEGVTYVPSCGATIRPKYLGDRLGSGVDVNMRYVARRIHDVETADVVALRMTFRRQRNAYEEDCGPWLFAVAEPHDRDQTFWNSLIAKYGRREAGIA